MSAPVPKNKWSWKFEKCQRCGTVLKNGKHKHKGRGFCLSCYDKERALKPERKIQLKKQSARWYNKVRNTDEYRKYCLARVKKWQHDPNSRYNKGGLKKIYLVRKFRSFLNRRRKLKRDEGGLKIRCDGCYKNCLIQTPFQPEKFNHKMHEMTLFKKIVIKDCKIKP